MTQHAATSPMMYRSREHRLLAGVCAGFAETLGINRLLLRMLVLVSLYLYTLPTLLFYLLAVFALDYATPQRHRGVEDPATKPATTDRMASGRRRFHELEQRMLELELRLARHREKRRGHL